MNRREFMQCAALLVSGAGVASVPFSLSAEQEQFLAAADNYNTGEANYFSDAQRRIVAAMAEVIIPRTDTPGAIDAGVPRFIELMVRDWLNDEERAIFEAGLKDIESRIPREFGASFDALDSDSQLAIMETLEEEASSSAWYRFGNVVRDFVSDAPFICQFKELTIHGFFTSERGSTEVLSFNMMPMSFDGDVPLDPGASTWAARIQS